MFAIFFIFVSTFLGSRRSAPAPLTTVASVPLSVLLMTVAVGIFRRRTAPPVVPSSSSTLVPAGMAFPGEVTHFATIIATLVAIFSPFGVVLELHFDLFTAKIALIVVFNTLFGGFVIFDLGEGETIFGVSVAFGN